MAQDKNLFKINYIDYISIIKTYKQCFQSIKVNNCFNIALNFISYFKKSDLN